MSAEATKQAAAIVTILRAVSGAPALVEWRKTDVLHPLRDDGTGDPDDAIILTGGPESVAGRYFGGGKLVGYPWQVSVYGRTTANVTATDTRPALVQACKLALSVTSLSGTSVWDYELAENSEWENQPFRNGVEVSRFGVLYRNSQQ